MSPDLAAGVIACAYLFAGFGVLAAAGMLPGGAMELLCSVGLAYVAGLAATMLLATALVCAGVAVHLATFALLSAAVGSIGIGFARLRGGGPQLARPHFAATSIVRGVRAWTAERWLVAVVGVVFVVYVVLGYRWAKVMPLTGWDGWSIWARKGIILLSYGNLPTGFFASPSYAFMHPDYPLLVPMFESGFAWSADRIRRASMSSSGCCLSPPWALPRTCPHG